MAAIRFITVGLVNTLVSLSFIYAAMYYLSLNATSANLLGYLIGIMLGFFLNKTWTFKNNSRTASSFIRYIIVIVIAYLVNLETVIFSISYLNINSYLAQVMGILPYTVIGYFGCKIFVFNGLATSSSNSMVNNVNKLTHKQRPIHNPVKLAIVVPCYNEEEVLPETNKCLLEILASMQAIGLATKNSGIYYVDDGSRDRTWELISRFNTKNSNVHGIKLSRNQGHQNALLAGIYNADGEAIVSIDADLQDDIKVIAEMVYRYNEGFEIVYGVRASRTSDTFFKRFTAQTYYRLLKLMGVDLVYNHADYRLMSHRVINCLKSYKEVNLFLRGIMPLLGFRTTTVFYDRNGRFAGKSKYPLRKMIALAANGITSFSVTPLRMITWLGFLVSIGSIAVAVWVVFGKYIMHTTVPGWASIVLSIYFLGGVQLLSIGILGEYISKIYMETKQRPLYFIEEMI